MPIYEYRCPACRNEFERLMKLNSEPPDCPSCGAGEVIKKVSASAFVLKGSGWYHDHYGLKSGGTKDSETTNAPSTTESTSPASDSSATVSTSDTKPAESTATKTGEG